MMKRIVLAVAVAALGVTAVVAQSDPIAARKALMKENGNQSRIAREMIEGKQPFDLAKAKKVLATFAAAHDKGKNLLPDNSKAGDTASLPAIWENKADFDAKLAKLRPTPRPQDAKVKDLDSFKAAMGEVGKNCGGCHNTYRKKASNRDIDPAVLTAGIEWQGGESDGRAALKLFADAARCIGWLGKGVVDAAQACRSGVDRRRGRLRRVLGRDHSRRPCRRARCRSASPNLDNGKTMFLIGGCASCHATPEQDDKTRLGGGFGLKSPFGTFYAPNISPDPNDGIGKWSEADFVTAMVKGTSPDGQHLFSGVSLHVLSAHEARRRARPVRLSEDAAGGAGASRSRTTCRFRSTSAARSAAGNSCSSTASRSSPIRPRTRRGIAAPIWSTVPATAPNAIRRATFSAASSRASASPAGRSRAARASCRTSRRRA